MSEQLILVRHGETLHNVAGIAQGSQDSELSERGRNQVRRLAQRIRSYAPDAIFSSPLGRALTTAEWIAEATALPITVLDDLREMNYGAWEGKSFLEVRSSDPESYRRWMGESAFPSPEGESHDDVLARMKRAFAVVSAAKRPVVVAHATAIRIGATALLNAPISMAYNLAQDNASINVFIWRADRCVLKVWNDTTHCTSES
ncbi:MAG: histidine phosphatase family protein [Thermoanaerobaculia bacterium]